MSDYVPDPLGVIGYSPSTGKFIWLQSGINRRKGDEAGSINGKGYVVCQYGGKTVQASNLAWRIMTGRWPDEVVDHINRVKSDNRFDNLRPATPAQNAKNRGKSSNNTSGFKGVSWNNRKRVWVARIMSDGKKFELGVYKTKEAAFEAYAEAAEALHGEFHCLE